MREAKTLDEKELKRIIKVLDEEKDVIRGLNNNDTSRNCTRMEKRK